MNQTDTALVQCPYYVMQRGQSIVCESGLRWSTTVSNTFEDKTARRAYVRWICSTNLWQRCPYAVLCDRKYEKEKEG